MLLETLKARGWKVKLRIGAVELLPPSVAARYPAVPHDLVEFLSSFELCENVAQRAWFFTAEDYWQEAGPICRWNECETIALQSCTEEDERTEVTAFWDAHLPFMIALHSDFDYLAVAVSGENKGKIVHGFAPFWEEPTVIAASFAEFLANFCAAATAEEPPWPESLFL
ncbi:MAG: hypothetical protein WC538_23630 [Thermoanaerobaculia bacterium]|jgi:hypothetical protein